MIVSHLHQKVIAVIKMEALILSFLQLSCHVILSSTYQFMNFFVNLWKYRDNFFSGSGCEHILNLSQNILVKTLENGAIK
jgi:hypothetical protein